MHEKFKEFFLIDKKKLIFVLCIIFFHALLETGIAVLIWILFDLLDKVSEITIFIYFGIGALIYIFLAALMNSADIYFTQKYVSLMTKIYREDLYKNIFNLNYTDFNKKTPDEYMTLINRDASTVSENLFKQFFYFIYQFLLFLTAIIISFVMNYIVAAILLVLSILVVVFPAIYRKKISFQMNKLSNDFLEFSKYIGNTFSGIDIVQNYGAIHNIADRIDSLNSKVYSSEIGKHKLIGQVNFGNYFVVLLLQISVALISGILSIYGKSTIAVSISFLNIASNVYNPISMMLSAYLDIMSTKDIVIKIANIKPSEEVAESSFFNVSKITLDNFSIKFNSKNLFNNVSFTFETGKKYLLTGESGSGKTTLLETLIGHNDDYRGHIFYDNIDGRDLTFEKKNQLIAYCKQTPHLFIGSLKENITLFAKQVDYAKLKKCNRFMSAYRLCSKQRFRYPS